MKNLFKSKKLVIVIFILFMVILSVSIFIFYNEVYQENNTSEMGSSEDKSDDNLDRESENSIDPETKPTLEPTSIPEVVPTNSVTQLTNCYIEGDMYEANEEVLRDNEVCTCRGFPEGTPGELRCDAIIDTPDIDISNWEIYESEEFNLTFRYPSDYKVEYRDQEVRVYNEVSIFGNDFEKDRLIISKDFEPLTYDRDFDNPDKTNPREMPPIEIEGEEYIFDKFVVGDGGQCSSSFISIYITEVNPDLNISLYKSIQSKYDPCEYTEIGLVKGESKNYKTSEKVLETTRKIISTIEFTNE
jgi:hypothetical protein